MAKQTLPYPPGFVEPTTGRVAVLVREYADSDLNGDAPAYWYSAQSEEWGLDPWRLVEGVDPHVGGGSFDVCFSSGDTRTVGPLMTFFLSAAHAAQLIDAKGEELAVQRATLAVIAAELGIPEPLRVEAKIEGRPAVFYDRDGSTLCACAVGSEFWNEAQAKALMASAIDKARTNF
uniref:KleF protein n=1 Tax=Yersinia pestis 16/95 TaxID=1365102 RepID=A0A193PYP1_YERPE|nr:FIG00467107: hypothetical protein [Yersinia pestis 16/95]